MNTYAGSVILRSNGLNSGTGRRDLIAAVSATITVKHATLPVPGLGVDADIFDINDTPIGNPLTVDGNGNYSFNIEDGIYDIIATSGAGQAISPSQEISSASGSNGGVDSIDVETNSLLITQTDHGKMFNVSDLTGSVTVTVSSVSTENIGIIVFVRSVTDSPIEFIGDGGVTIETPDSLFVVDKFSTVALMPISETVWVIMGRLA